MRNYCCNVFRNIVVPHSKRYYQFYADVEDRLFLEEYEDPNQEFSIQNFDEDFQDISKKLSSKKMTTIN